jgi:hypothetical protein
MISRATLATPWTFLLAWLLGVLSCGEAIYVVQESQLRVVPARVDLPKNLSLATESLDAPPDAKLIAITQRVQAMAMDDRDKLILAMSASGVFHAHAPVWIHSFQVLVSPAHPSAYWAPYDGQGVTQLSFPRAMEEGEEARWHWLSRAAIDDRIFEGLEFQTRVVYEVLR